MMRLTLLASALALGLAGVPAAQSPAFMTVTLGPVHATLPGDQGWTVVARGADFVTAVRHPRPGHTLEMSFFLHPVAEPLARRTLLKRPREATDPYLSASRAGLDTPEFPEIYFEAFPWRTADLQCRFFQAISDEGASTLPPGGQRLLRTVGAVCGVPAHGVVLEMRLTGTQPHPTDTYRDLNTDAETVFEGLVVDPARITP